MNRTDGCRRRLADGRAGVDRFAAAVVGALYCLGSVYVVLPIETVVVLDELHVGCDARRGVRDLERWLAAAE